MPTKRASACIVLGRIPMTFRQRSFLSLSVGGFHRIAYLDWGNPSSAHVTVCVHGLSRNCRDFDYLARELAAHCRIVCMDVVGRGDSEWLADKSDYSFSTYLTDAAMLIARITAPRPPTFFGTFGDRRKPTAGPASIAWAGASYCRRVAVPLAGNAASPSR